MTTDLAEESDKIPIHVLHVASGDAWGGAECVLEELVAQSIRDIELRVDAALMNEGRLAHSLRMLGVSTNIIDESQLSFWSICRQLRRQFHESNANVIHAHRYKELCCAMIAAFPKTSKVIITVHGLEPGLVGSQNLLRVWLFLLLGRILGVKIVCVSEELRSRVSSRLHSSLVKFIPNPMRARTAAPIDLRGQLGWPKDCKVVGFVGRLEPVKGPDLFLEVVRKANSNLRFVLVGTGSMFDQLAQQIVDSALGNRVAMLGEVEDARPYIEALDVVALTSRHEGTPMVVLEAASAGVPVVAFNVGGVSDLLRECMGPSLVPVRNTRKFAVAIQDLLARDNIQDEAKEWGTKLAFQLNPQAVLAAYKEVYRTAN